eukprot:gene16974-18685_t
MDMPDLPSWLKLEQKSPGKPAFLYGTPQDKDIGQVFLEVIAWNKDDYSTVKKFMRITIGAKPASQVKYQTDFKVTNFDLADFLLGKKYEAMVQIVRKNWPNAHQVTDIDKTTNRPGGRFTPTGFKEGVFITVASENIQPIGLKQAKYCPGQTANPQSSLVHSSFIDTEFAISWCRLSFIELTLTSTGQQASTKDSKASFEESTYLSVPLNNDRQSIASDRFYVLIPVILGAIFLIVLTYVMCCKREGLSKRNAMTPREQLQHHESLRRATYRMRTMNSKDHDDGEDGAAGPSNGTYSYGRLDDDTFNNPEPKRDEKPERSNPSHSLTPGANQRSVPPPYRMPPTMPSDQVSDTDSVPSRPPPYKKPEQDEGRW